MPPPSPALRLVPHLLTFSRMPLGVAFLLVFDPTDLRATVAALLLIVAAAVTDALDGHLARRLGLVSTFGKWADPLTDALFFLFAYIAFHRAGMMPAAIVVVFAARETAQYAVIRPLTVLRGNDPGARPAGKIKTGAQIGGASLVVILSGASAVGAFPLATLQAVSTVVLAVLVAVSAASLYWYIRPLVTPRE